MNEKRFDDYLSAYHKVMEKFTTLIVIYSAISIFLPPLTKAIVYSSVNSLMFIVCFSIFLGLFALSVLNAVKFLVPQDIPYLKQPREFYTVLLEKYRQQPPTLAGVSIDDLLKASYSNELETAQTAIMTVLRHKGNLYYKGLVYSLLSAVPYVICLGYYFSIDEPVRDIHLLR